MALLFLVVALLLLCRPSSSSSSGSVGLRIIHKFSDEARELGLFSGPESGSLEYYRELHRHDLARHGRRRLQQNGVSLVQGNYTEDLGPSFGGIHYAIVDIGTPNVSFLVALDTGSDLFWVPCDCKQCETETFPELKIELTTFNSKLSNTSKPVSCGDSLCTTRCSSGTCPYTVNYLSENTSTSGKLLQDVIYLRDASDSEIKAAIVFGCGEVQTGLFLRGGAPNGLLGLGPGPLSLPSLLAKDGIIADSFSMCFDRDGTGRLLFGDKGTSSQQTTPFITVNGQNQAYFIGVEEIHVGNFSTSSSFRALFDTGTTLTYLPSSVYDAVTRSFNSQVQDKYSRLHGQNLDPYEFCYKYNEQNDTAPDIYLQFSGGKIFRVAVPFLYLVQRGSQKVQGFCMAVLKGDIPIIGQNFMEGYHLTFDRELSRLGWNPANCYQPNATVSLGPMPQLNTSSSSSPSEDNSPFVRPRDRTVVGSGGSRKNLSQFAVFFLLLVLLHVLD